MVSNAGIEKMVPAPQAKDFSVWIKHMIEELRRRWKSGGGGCGDREKQQRGKPGPRGGQITPSKFDGAQSYLVMGTGRRLRTA